MSARSADGLQVDNVAEAMDRGEDAVPARLTSMRLVNLLVPGLGNLHKTAFHLHEMGVLNRFIYSHALSTTPASLGLPDDRALNLPVKEYLTRGHLMMMGLGLSDRLFPVYNGFWERGVLWRWQPASVVHMLLWGAGGRVLARVRSEGSTTLGLVANAHPDLFRELLAEEADRIGVKRWQAGKRLPRAVLGEVALCDHLHAESEFVRSSFAARGFPAERIHIVRPGKDLSSFYPGNAEEIMQARRKFRVLCVGAISLRKGQVHLLEAWRQLSLPDAELTLLGGISSEIEPLIRSHRMPFEHIVRVPDVRPYFVRSSVMVIPSIEDGHAHVVGEALACGIPVIATKNTGAADYIRDGVNGYVVPIASPEAIAEKLLALYRDRDLLSSLQEGARATIPVVGSWEDRARDLAALYRKIAPAGFFGREGNAKRSGTMVERTGS